MPANRSTPAAAKRAAVAAAAGVTRGIEAALATATESGKPSADGRKRRWEQHKADRRAELVDGTVDAVRTLGSDVGMDEIAAHIGVSKTVLYRYFADKSDLARAVTGSYFTTELLPRLLEAIVDDRDEFAQMRAIIAAYVSSVGDDPHLYRFVTARAGTSALDEPEAVVVKLLTSVINARLTQRSSQTDGSTVFAHAVVGATRQVVNWWTDDRVCSADDLIDYLTMMLWSAAVGIAGCGGSPERFNTEPPPLPGLR